MMKQLFPIILLVFISGCSSLPDWVAFWEEEPDEVQTTPYPVQTSAGQSASNGRVNVVDVTGPGSRRAGIFNWQTESSDQQSQDAFGSAEGQPRYGSGQGVYNGRMLTKHIGDYVQNMAQDLIGNMEYLSNKTPVGVTHFALLDSNLRETNLLGYQLAESFMHELHKFRIPVIDYKATDFIRVTPEGDFFLSRDFLELRNKEQIEYILTGTMTRHQGGMLVNARMLGLKSKAVVASAQMLIPFYVVDALLPNNEDEVDGVQFIEG